MAAGQISAAEAVKAFKGQSIVVRVAKPVKVKGADKKVRDAFEVTEVPLAEAHVIGASNKGERIVIVTVDGRKHEATTRGAAA